jgi:hypothetical protein
VCNKVTELALLLSVLKNFDGLGCYGMTVLMLIMVTKTSKQ